PAPATGTRTMPGTQREMAAPPDTRHEPGPQPAPDTGTADGRAHAAPGAHPAEAPPTGVQHGQRRAWGVEGGEEARVGTVVALAFPERVARLDGGSYLTVAGTRAEVGAGSALRGAEWLAVAVADRPVGRGHARVGLGAAVDEDIARYAAGAL